MKLHRITQNYSKLPCIMLNSQYEWMTYKTELSFVKIIEISFSENCEYMTYMTIIKSLNTWKPLIELNLFIVNEFSMNLFETNTDFWDVVESDLCNIPKYIKNILT